MSAQLSEQFHVKLAKEFVEALTAPEKDNIYLFIGRGTPWPNGADTNSAALPVPSTSVANGTYDYWRDMFALLRISASNTSHVVPRRTWTSNARYSMYDHRISRAELFANSTNPVYVINESTRDVFKCLYNGRSNSTSEPSQSTVAPDIQLIEDYTQLLTTPGNPKEYVWKYLYTVDSTDPYLTTNYIPVRAIHDTLDPTTGDVKDDGSNQYDVFNTARLTNNGAIYTIVVENPGTGYANSAEPPVITITGDGEGATAQAVLENNAVSRIYMTSYGQNYSYATVSFSGGSPVTSATATAIISPRHAFANVTLGSGATSNVTKTFYRTNHGIDVEQELDAKYVMIYKQIPIEIADVLPTASTSASYRRIGLVRNPLLAGTSNVASANAYTTLTRLTVSGGNIANFTPGEIISQPTAQDPAYGVLVGRSGNTLWLSNVRGTFEAQKTVVGIGNGDAAGYGNIPATPDAFTPVIPPSTTSATVTGVTLPSIAPYSGEILFVNHDTPTTRSDQTQTVRIVLTF